MNAEPGAVLGKYRLVSLLGRGGGGDVWKARDDALNRDVAVKVLRQLADTDVARFTREAQTAARLVHPNIASVFEVGESDGFHYIALQFVDGHTLSHDRHGAPRTAGALIRDAARAVQFAHENGVIHRDLKPANLMTDSSGRLYVMDFGLAKETAVASSLSVSGFAVGTPAYMPPEQARGQAREIGPASDVYSLGATLFELLAGRPPFEGTEIYDLLRQAVDEEAPPLRTVRDGLDRDIETIVGKCLEKEGVRRYATAGELADDLTRWLEREPIHAHPLSLAARLIKRLSKRPLLTAAIALALIGGVVAAIFIPGYLRESRLRRERDAQIERQRDLKTKVDGRFALLQEKAKLLDASLATSQARDTVSRRAAETLETANQVLQLDPNHYDAGLVAARAQLELEKPTEALAILDRLVAMAPDGPGALFLRGMRRLDEYMTRRSPTGVMSGYMGPMFTARRRPDTDEERELSRQASADLDRLATLWKEDDLRLLVAACLDLVRGADEDARAKFRRAIDVRPDEAPRLLVWSGLAALNSRNLDAALADFERAIRLRPSCLPAHFWRVEILEYRWDYEAALAAYDEMLRVDPANRRARNRRAWALKQMGDFDGALAGAREILKDDPRDAGAVNTIGVILMNQGNREVEQHYRDAIALMPDPTFYINLAEALSHMRRYGDSEKTCTDGLAKYPGHRILLYRRMSARYQQGRFSGVLEDADAGLTQLPEDMPSLENRINALLRLGRQDEANAGVKLLVRLADQSADAALALSYLASKAEDRLRFADQAVQIDSDSAEARMRRLDLLMEAGRAADALKDADAIVRRRPKDPSLLIKRATVLLQLGDYPRLKVDAQATFGRERGGVSEKLLGLAELFGGGDPAEAAKLLAISVRRAADWSGYAYLALALKRSGDAEGSSAALKEGTRLNPTLFDDALRMAEQKATADLPAAALRLLAVIIELAEDPAPRAKELMEECRKKPGK